MVFSFHALHADESAICGARALLQRWTRSRRIQMKRACQIRQRQLQRSQQPPLLTTATDGPATAAGTARSATRAAAAAVATATATVKMTAEVVPTRKAVVESAKGIRSRMVKSSSKGRTHRSEKIALTENAQTALFVSATTAEKESRHGKMTAKTGDAGVGVLTARSGFIEGPCLQTLNCSRCLLFACQGICTSVASLTTSCFHAYWRMLWVSLHCGMDLCSAINFSSGWVCPGVQV